MAYFFSVKKVLTKKQNKCIPDETAKLGKPQKILLTIKHNPHIWAAIVLWKGCWQKNVLGPIWWTEMKRESEMLFLKHFCLTGRMGLREMNDGQAKYI